MAVIEARAALDRHALAGAGEGVERQLGVVSADERGNIQIERLGALVQEGEGVILRASSIFRYASSLIPVQAASSAALLSAVIRAPRSRAAIWRVSVCRLSIVRLPSFLNFAVKKALSLQRDKAF